jgi:hypothetical protein
MKKSLALCLVVLACSALVLGADAGSWTGVISDAKCGGKMPHTAACVEKCIAGDGKAVLMVGDKAYAITNPDKVKGHELHKVTVTGHLDAAKSEITVEKLEMAN